MLSHFLDLSGAFEEGREAKRAETKDQSQLVKPFWVACEAFIIKLHAGRTHLLFSFLLTMSPGSAKFMNLSANSAELPVAVPNLQLLLCISF